jgi:hypothetical protein
VARRPKREGDDDLVDDGGDFAIQLNPFPTAPQGDAPAPAPRKRRVSKRPKPVDADEPTEGTPNMSVAGVAQAKPNLMIQLENGRVVELQPGWSQTPDASIVVDDQPKVIVAGATPVPRVTAPMKFAEPRGSGSGMWLTVVMYLMASAALAAAIYERWFA